MPSRRFQRSRRASQAAGFSLAEVMVAMFVMVVGIAGVTSTIWWGSQRSDSGKLIQEASNLGRIIVETISARGIIAATEPGAAWLTSTSGLNDDANERRPIEAAPLAGQLPVEHIINSNVNTQSNVERFRRNITCARLGGGDPNAYDDALCTLQVSVYWQEQMTDDSNARHREHHITHEVVLPHGRT